MGGPVEGDVAVSAILASLNDEYDNLVIAMEAWEDNRLTLPNVKAKLMEEWERKRDRQADVALKTKEKMVDAVTCYFCKQPGHMKKDCKKFSEWKKKRANKESARTTRTDKWYMDWCIDSGASSHMCCDRNAFTRLSTSSSRNIVMANGNVICS